MNFMNYNIITTMFFLVLSVSFSVAFFNFAQREILKGSKITNEKGSLKPEGIAYIAFGVVNYLIAFIFSVVVLNLLSKFCK